MTYICLEMSWIQNETQAQTHTKLSKENVRALHKAKGEEEEK